MGEGDVEQSVAVHVHDGDAARVEIVQRLGLEGQIAQIPEDLALVVNAGEDQIEIAVAVQIVGGHAGAVAEIGADLTRTYTGNEVQVMGHERARAEFCVGEIEFHHRYVDHLRGLRLCGRRSTRKQRYADQGQRDVRENGSDVGYHRLLISIRTG